MSLLLGPLDAYAHMQTKFQKRQKKLAYMILRVRARVKDST